MDCLQAREIVSEAFDRGVEGTLGAAEAREHCRSCEDCRAFVAGLVALRDAPKPVAPPAVIDAVMERARMMAAADAEEAGARAQVGPPPAETQEAAATAPTSGGPVAWEPDLTAPVPARPRERFWWVPRASAYAAAAAVVVVAIVVTIQGFGALRGGEAGIDPEAARTAYDSGATGGALAGAPAPGGNAASSVTSGALDAAKSSGGSYVAYDGMAWVMLGERTLDRTTLQQVGTVSSTTDTTGTPAREFNAWTSKTDPTVLFIEVETDRWMAFQLVTRMRGGKRYALSAESGITGYGQWPTLPTGFKAPEKPDGSPSMVQAGTDDTGLPVFAPLGASADAGFALAPGTSSTDPAGGNPNWTWWVPRQ
jgi:hypothetical protein